MGGAVKQHPLKNPEFPGLAFAYEPSAGGWNYTVVALSLPDDTRLRVTVRVRLPSGKVVAEGWCRGRKSDAQNEARAHVWQRLGRALAWQADSTRLGGEP